MDRKNLGIFRKDSAVRYARQMKGPYLFTLCQTSVPSLQVKMRCLHLRSAANLNLHSQPAAAGLLDPTVMERVTRPTKLGSWQMSLCFKCDLGPEYSNGPLVLQGIDPNHWSSQAQFHPCFPYSQMITLTCISTKITATYFSSVCCLLTCETAPLTPCFPSRMYLSVHSCFPFILP